MEFLPLCPIEKLIPYENNPRLITDEDVERLVTIIDSSGFLDPIEVDAGWEIVAGHRRRLAALKLGLKRVPVIYHSAMTKDEARKYRIANQKAGEHVKWNRELLSNEMMALEHQMESAAELGMSEVDVAKLFDIDMADKTDEELKEMEGKAEPGPYIRTGQRWVSGPITFQVYENLNDDQLRKAEAIIAKLKKLTKEEPVLEGDGTTFKAYLAEAVSLEGGLR
jgi:phosphoribosylformylglycinamidine (FGAM) synthase PurS component